MSEAFVDVDGQVVKVFSNRMVDMAHFVSFDPEACGITEKVRFEVLCELLDQCGGDEAALQELAAERKDDLVPKHIIVDDIMASINYLCSLSHGVGTPDDIDHLGNRRLRCVGELLQNQFRIGFSRMERVIRERMTIQDLDIVTPQSLINIRPVTAAIKEFFGSSPCPSLWTRPTPWQSSPTSGVCPPWAPAACPVTGPPSTSVTSTTATTAVCAPLRPPGRPQHRPDFLPGHLCPDQPLWLHRGPLPEGGQGHRLCHRRGGVHDRRRGGRVHGGQATEPLDENGCLANARITCRHRDEIVEVDREKVDYIDVSPKMMVSMATAMIPFLENDDANRALMGANMQRQAVPLLHPGPHRGHRHGVQELHRLRGRGAGQRGRRGHRVSATNITVRL